MKLPEEILSFARTVALNKGRAYVVGGAVRDELLGLPVDHIKDIDIEVHGLHPFALRRVVESHFKNVHEQGASFGVLNVQLEDYSIDISLPRTDSKTGEGHTGFTVHVDPKMGVEAAAKRRDFTINAMMRDVVSWELIDPVGGVEDLKRKILRVVDPQQFQDDPLRVYRAVQFVGRFELTVEEETKQLLMSMHRQLSELSKDRIREEWKKLFLKAPKPSLGLELAREVGAYGEAQDLMDAMATCEQDPEWHPEGTVWAHTIWGADVIAELAVEHSLSDHDRLTIALANLLHDIGKPEKTKLEDGHVRSKGHVEAGVAHVKTVLKAFGLEPYADLVEPLVLLHHAPFALRNIEQERPLHDGDFIKVARNCKPATAHLLSLVVEADLRSRGPYENLEGKRLPEIAHWFAHECEMRDVLHRPPEDVISGRDLIKMGLQPGPVFGEIVRQANTWFDEEGLTKGQVLERIKNERL